MDAITYDPYGYILNQTNSANEPRLLYTGGALNSLTGDYQFGVRPYSGADGRFVTQDWKAFAAGNTDLYGYVFNAPLNDTDPSGLDPIRRPQAVAHAVRVGRMFDYIDFNITGGFVVGVTGGFQYDTTTGTWHPYLGFGLVTPGIGGSVTMGEGFSPGWQWGIGGGIGLVGQFGCSLEDNGGSFIELGLGAPPGASATIFYIW